MTRIAIYSDAGGVGKSFIAANLAYNLFQQGAIISLCEMSTHKLLPIHFGSSLEEAAKLNSVYQSEQSAGYQIKMKKLDTFSLHKDFTLVSLGAMADIDSDASVVSAMKWSERIYSGKGIMIFDLPTGVRFEHGKTLFDIELEVISADPVSLSASYQRHRSDSDNENEYRLAKERYSVLNKMDLRSELSQDAVSMAENLFSDRLLGCIHFDTAVPESFAHNSLVSEYAPHSQACIDVRNLSGIVYELIRELSPEPISLT